VLLSKGAKGSPEDRQALYHSRVFFIDGSASNIFKRGITVVKHIVFWKLKKSALGRSKAENAQLIKEKLEALNGRIPGLLSLEVGLDFSQTKSSADVAAYCTFANREDLGNYLVHPEHEAVVPFIVKVSGELRVADYEV
jgi:hypothetical protein